MQSLKLNGQNLRCFKASTPKSKFDNLWRIGKKYGALEISVKTTNLNLGKRIRFA